MYDVLIFGTGMSSVSLENALNSRVRILEYIDNDKSKWGEYKEFINAKEDQLGAYIRDPLMIKDFKYDYILIASQYNNEIYNQLIGMDINREKIFQYHSFLDTWFNYYKCCIDIFLMYHGNKTELLITGISYARTGFKPEICTKESYNFALGSQDIFYDFHTIKYLLENFKDKVVSVKYIIIGLSYYSFQYDMSLSSMKNKVVLYYEVLKEAHHFTDIQRVYDEYSVNKTIADNIFSKREDGTYEFNWKVPEFVECGDKWEKGKKQANRDCNKSYTKTIRENIEIFEDYLELLKSNNIKPIIVVFPASKYYTKYFSKIIEEEFHSIIKGVKKEYDFQYIDYFRSDLFIDEDFQDVSHLNSKGAEKFTKILNEEIEW